MAAETSSLSGNTTYVVQPGDTLYMVARRFGVGLSELISANPQVEDPGAIDVGLSLQIPSASESSRSMRCLILHPGRMTPRAEGVIILDYPRSRASVLAHNLPAPSYVSCETYKVWLRNSVAGGYDVALLYPTPSGVWAARLEARSSLRDYDGVLVTGESVYNDEKPVGPVVISAGIEHD